MALAAPAAIARQETTPLSAICVVPEPLLGLPGSLDRAAAKLAGGATVTVLAIGSSSTQGVGASGPDATYPARLVVELERRFGAGRFEVVNRGIGGEVAAQTAQRLRAEVTDVRPDIVIWQVGTNDALRDVSADDFAAVLADGIGWLEEQGLDIVLMDPQYFPRIDGQEGYRRFVDGVASVAERQGVAVMRRFDAMRHWANVPVEGRFAMLAADDFHLNDVGYSCVAEVLAKAIRRRLDAR